MPESNLPDPAAALSRRTMLAVPAFGGLAFLGLHAAAQQSPNQQPASAAPAPDTSAWSGFPRQPLTLARDFVTAAHGNLAKVQEMLKVTPGLVHATWDWGFGDWENAMGAASHTGNRAIAQLLLDSGARLDIFGATMLGMLDVVKGLIAARPGIERTLGPHHITLLTHAKAGGADAAPVAEFLATLPGADTPPASLPVDEALAATYAGTFAFGDGAADRFTIYFEKTRLNFRVGDSQPRWLYRCADHEFYPSGVPSVRMRFAISSAKAVSVEILAPEPRITARRVEG